MPLDSGFLRKLKPGLCKHEGVRDYFYRDSVGQVTIGVGHLVRTETDATRLHLARRDDHRPATIAEIVAAFNAVKNEPFKHTGVKDHKTHVWGSSHYLGLKGAGNIFMPPREVDRLLDRHIAEFYRNLQLSFSAKHGYKRDFDAFPENVRLALFDMIFNLGPTKFPWHWPALVKALKAENWHEAARQSRRPQLSADRNKYVHDLFTSAGR